MIAQPMDTAKTEDEQRQFLLFCPTQGGWHTGCFFEGRWCAWIDLRIELFPARWMDPPADPPGVDELSFVMGAGRPLDA